MSIKIAFKIYYFVSIVMLNYFRSDAKLYKTSYFKSYLFCWPRNPNCYLENNMTQVYFSILACILFLFKYFSFFCNFVISICYVHTSHGSAIGVYFTEKLIQSHIYSPIWFANKLVIYEALIAVISEIKSHNIAIYSFMIK